MTTLLIGMVMAEPGRNSGMNRSSSLNTDPKWGQHRYCKHGNGCITGVTSANQRTGFIPGTTLVLSVPHQQISDAKKTTTRRATQACARQGTGEKRVRVTMSGPRQRDPRAARALRWEEKGEGERESEREGGGEDEMAKARREREGVSRER